MTTNRTMKAPSTVLYMLAIIIGTSVIDIAMMSLVGANTAQGVHPLRIRWQTPVIYNVQ